MRQNKKYLIGIFPEKLSATEKNSRVKNLLDLNFLLIALIYDHINSNKGAVCWWRKAFDFIAEPVASDAQSALLDRLLREKTLFISPLIN